MPVHGSDSASNQQFEYEQYLLQQQTAQQDQQLNNVQQQATKKEPTPTDGVLDPLVFGSVPEAPQEPPPQHG